MNDQKRVLSLIGLTIVCLVFGFGIGFSVQLEKINNFELQVERLEENVFERNLEEEQVLKNLKTMAVNCYWSSQFLFYPEESKEHFRGKDYTYDYLLSCIKDAELNWTTINQT